MMNITKFVPWLVACVAVLGAGAVWHRFQLDIQSLEVQLAASQQRVAERDSELATVKGALLELRSAAKAKVERLDEELKAANLPEATVRISFRKALLSSGNVAAFASTADVPIAILATLSRPSSGQSKLYELTLDPKSLKEIGEREGWAFVAGDQIAVEQPDHKGLIVSVP